MTIARIAAASALVVLALACGRPPTRGDSPEAIVRFFLASAAAGEETAARSVSAMPDVPHVEAATIVRTGLARAETGDLSTFRLAFADARKAEGEILRARRDAGPSPDVGVEARVLAARTRITEARTKAPLLFELYDGGRAALFFGDHPFQDLVGPYEVRRVDVEVAGDLWTHAESNRKPGPYAVRLARVKAFGDEGRWLIYDVVDRGGRSILVRTDSALPPGVRDMNQILEETQGAPAAAR